MSKQIKPINEAPKEELSIGTTAPIAATANDQEGKLRIAGPLYDRWLRRCHREGINPDATGAMWLERALRRDRPLTADLNDEKL